MKANRPQRRRAALLAPHFTTSRAARTLLAALTCVAAGISGTPSALAAKPLPQTGVPLAQLLDAAPQLDSSLVWTQQAAAASRGHEVHAPELAAGNAASHVTAAVSAAARSGATLGSIVQVRPGATINVHSAPDGSIVETLDSRSDSGSEPRAFTVYQVQDDGEWLGVSVPALDGHLGWIRADPSELIVLAATDEIRVSLRMRTLTLLTNGHVTLHTKVVIGSPGTPTPAGQFSVDDKLNFSSPSPEYGIGVLALSVPPPGRAWQTWRVAIHGLNNLGQLGGTGSLGCVHVPTNVLRTLLDRVPVGTPVDILA